MATKLMVDEAAYVFSSMMWKKLTGLLAENVVGNLSAGKAIVPCKESEIVKAINALLKRIDKFVPRVRIEGEGSAKYGADCRTFIASWRRRLTNIRTTLKRNTNVVYLTDKVNDIINKPVNDEIARLRESIKVELAAEKEHKELTPEQTQRLASVKEAIAKQYELKRNAPRCTNAILTTILHESVDNISADDMREIAELNRKEVELERIIAEKTGLISDKQNPLVNNTKAAAQTTIESEVQQLHSTREKRFGIMREYYRCLSPQTVADTLIRCDGTFWSEIPITQTFKEVEVKMTSKKKPAKAAVPAGDVSQEQQPVNAAKSKGRRRRKQTQAEVAEAMMLFPYSVGSAQTDSELESKIAADNRVFDEYDSFVSGFTGKSFNEEYRAKYEDCRRRFRTAPKLFSTFNDGAKADTPQKPAAPTSPLQPVTAEEILKYIFSFTQDGKQGIPIPQWIRERYQAAAERLAKNPNGARIFAELKEKNRTAIKSGTQLRYTDIVNDIVKAAQN